MRTPSQGSHNPDFRTCWKNNQQKLLNGIAKWRFQGKSEYPHALTPLFAYSAPPGAAWAPFSCLHHEHHNICNMTQNTGNGTFRFRHQILRRPNMARKIKVNSWASWAFHSPAISSFLKLTERICNGFLQYLQIVLLLKPGSLIQDTYHHWLHNHTQNLSHSLIKEDCTLQNKGKGITSKLRTA